MTKNQVRTKMNEAGTISMLPFTTERKSINKFEMVLAQK